MSTLSYKQFNTTEPTFFRNIPVWEPSKYSNNLHFPSHSQGKINFSSLSRVALVLV